MKKSRKLKKEKNMNWEGCCNCNQNTQYTHIGGAVYGLGFIGAAVYYISTASSFWMGVLGVLKSLVWPAFLVFELLKFLA